jgi:hypothetical protein
MGNLRDRDLSENSDVRGKWKDNIKMHLQYVGWGGPDCIDLAQDRDRWRAVVNAVLNFRVL